MEEISDIEYKVYSIEDTKQLRLVFLSPEDYPSDAKLKEIVIAIMRDFYAYKHNEVPWLSEVTLSSAELLTRESFKDGTEVFFEFLIDYKPI